MTYALRRSRACLPVFLAVAVALLAFASTATAAKDPIAGGTTDLHMKKGFLRKLSNLGVTVRAIGVGSLTGNKLSFPVDGGTLDPTDGKGVVESRGGFKLELGRRGVPVTRMTVDTSNLLVFAQVAKARMQIGALIPYTSAREGFGANFKSVKLVLTPKAVQRISNRLGLKGSKRLNPGRVLSNAYGAVQPEAVTVLKEGNATLTADPATLAKFAAKGVKVPEGITPIAPATNPKPALFQLPIKGGDLALDASAGTLEVEGGMQVLKDTETLDPTLRLRNVKLNFGTKSASAELEILPTPPFPGAIGTRTLVDLTLPPGSVVANPTARTIAISGEARLQAVAASTLNDVFNQPAPPPPSSSNFVVGDPLGTLSLTAQAQ